MFPKFPGGELHWELWEPSWNLQNPTQMLSYDGMNNQPLHIVNISFSSTRISSIISFFPGCPSSFVDRRMGHYEWMAWMWSAHETTPSIHIASMTWLVSQSHQTFHLVPAVKLLGIMLRNRCRPTTFHTIATEDADGWSHTWLV